MAQKGANGPGEAAPRPAIETRDGPRDACTTYLEQTKLLVTLASAFILAPTAVIPLVTGKDGIPVIASSVTELAGVEGAFVASVLAGYFVLATIAGAQNDGEYNVHRGATRIWSLAQLGTYVLGLVLFGHFLITVLGAAATATLKK